MTLLHPAESIEVTIIVVKLLLGTGHTFFGGAKIDVVLLVIAWHEKIPPFSISLETEEAQPQKWVQTQDLSLDEVFSLHSEIAAGPLKKAAVCIRLYRRVPLSHPGSVDAAACGERFYVMPGTKKETSTGGYAFICVSVLPVPLM